LTSGIVNLDFPLEFCLGEPRQRPRGNHQSDEDEDPDFGSKRRGTSVGKKDAKKTKKDEERQQQRSAPVEARREPPPG